VGCGEEVTVSIDNNRRRDADGRFVQRYSDELRAAVKVDYEAQNMTTREIALHHKVYGSTIDDWARKYEWVRRQPRRIDPNDLVSRMLELLSGQIADLETVMKNGAT
jgi:hypothetical protein